MTLSSSASLIDTLVVPAFPFDMKNIDPAFQRDVDTAKDCGVELIPKNQRLIAQRIRGQPPQIEEPLKSFNSLIQERLSRLSF